MPDIGLRFRPSLVIFVDEPGRQICEQLKQIVKLTQFETVLHQCIALIQVKVKDMAATSTQSRVSFDQAIPVPLSENFPPDDDDMPVGPAELEELIAASLTSIQLNKRLLQIRDAAYPVPETRPQIYIVGSAGSQALRVVYQMIQTELRRQFFATEVCYILDAYEAAQSGTVRFEEDLVPPQPNDPYWQGDDVPNFCFFYENYLRYPVPSTITLKESHYAAAESLFALIATGITPEPGFANFMRSPARLTSYSNVGSMSTTLLIFPHEAALTFSSARLGSELVEQWLDDLNRELLPEEDRRRLQRQARSDVEKIERWIKDTELRPAANEDVRKVADEDNPEIIENEGELNRWPTLHILKDKLPTQSERDHIQSQSLLRDLEDQVGELFQRFHFSEVEQEARRYRKRPDIWVRLVDQRGQRAVEAHYEWNQIATRAWEATSICVQDEIQYRVDTLWSDRKNGILGFEMARTYVDAFDDQMVKLQDRLIRLRGIHRQSYIESLDRFEQLSIGEWLHLPGIQNNQGNENAGATQASPTMGGVSTPGPVPAGGASGSGAPVASGAATHWHLPAREVQIVDQMERRILWSQEQVPSIPTQFAISLPFLLALVLASLAIYPQGDLLVTGEVALGSGLLIALGNGLFWRRYWDKVKKAKKDLLRFYRRHFAYRSEVREDALRLLVMVPLRRRVMAMRERLDNIAAFLGGVRSRLDESSQQIRHNFFSTPSGVRDIYIVNGERLQRRGRNTLEDLAAQVTHLRENGPVPWHRTLSGIKEHLIELFRQQSMIEMTEDDAWRQIDTFAREITRRYLHGQLVDIQRALENRDIWSEARERAGSPLYQALVGFRKPELFFVCGNPAILTPLSGARTGDLSLNGNSARKTVKWPFDAIPVSISDHHNWVLFIAFFKGGTPPALDPAILFPPQRNQSSPDDDPVLATEGMDLEEEDITSSGSLPFSPTLDDDDDNTAPRDLVPGTLPRTPAPNKEDDGVLPGGSIPPFLPLWAEEDDDDTPPKGLPRVTPGAFPLNERDDDDDAPPGGISRQALDAEADQDLAHPNFDARQRELMKFINQRLRNPANYTVDSEQQ